MNYGVSAQFKQGPCTCLATRLSWSLHTAFSRLLLFLSHSSVCPVEILGTPFYISRKGKNSLWKCFFCMTNPLDYGGCNKSTVEEQGKTNLINKKDQQLIFNQQGFFQPCSITLTLFKITSWKYLEWILTLTLFSPNVMGISQTPWPSCTLFWEHNCSLNLRSDSHSASWL